MSSFSSHSLKFTDLNFASDPKIPRLEAKPVMKFTDLDGAKKVKSTEKISPPIVEQITEFTSNAIGITPDVHNDIHSGSDSEFPELPSFKEIPFSPITPRKQPQYPYSSLTAHFPPTPETTPARRPKRYTSQVGSPCRSRSFKKTLRKASLRPSLISLTPPSSIFHELKPKPADSISALEFDRMAEAVMQQVDWKAVSEHVASNRPEGVFKRIIATILKEKVGKLKRSEKEKSAAAAELGT